MTLHQHFLLIPSNSFPSVQTYFPTKSTTLCQDASFGLVKKLFNPLFFEKGTTSLNKTFYPEARSKHAKHMRCYSLFNKEKIHQIYLVGFVSVNITRRVYCISLSVTQCNTWPTFIHIHERFFIHAESQNHFQNKQNKEEDLTGLHKLAITIQTSKVNNPQSLNSYTMCNTKLSGTGSPLEGIHLLQVLEIIQQDSSHWTQAFLKPLESICKWIFRVRVH